MKLNKNFNKKIMRNFKKRQQNYKSELDKIYQELMKRRKGFYGDFAKKEEENLKFMRKD